MAFQRDYVLRIIEMMGDVFRKLGEMLDERERMQALDRICRDQCGLSLQAAFALKEDTVKELLPPQTLFLLSEITYMQAEWQADEADRDAHYYRALRLLSALSGEDAVCEARHQRLQELMQRCREDLTAADYLACARFFMAGGKFDDGEDAVFHAVEAAGNEPGEYLLAGRALLIEILSLSDQALVLGGLPRNEVFDAIHDLEKWEKA